MKKILTILLLCSFMLFLGGCSLRNRRNITTNIPSSSQNTYSNENSSNANSGNVNPSSANTNSTDIKDQINEELDDIDNVLNGLNDDSFDVNNIF